VPELPEVEALAAYLRERAVGLDVTRVDVAAISALKTFDPPITSLKDQPLTGTRRWGKFLDLQIGDKHLVIHLARAGWLHYRDSLPPHVLAGLEHTRQVSAIGSRETVRAGIEAFIARTQVDELIVAGATYDPAARRRSLALTMEALG